ncbi:PREDICTED: uncharacterized protein LOC104591538 isoform X2 [Nelumbo nucifera]|uniref:Uncharacterized protein LOC104591538 isoform X2 n=1 Tax=Nelumbo nucifera TaxID=4432 RepID=A0A1U7ZLD8_NELNU|nr:PREDICTED: uncharacterized protein LOC104591538 isoform X2 [Nelumbo nucifera]
MKKLPFLLFIILSFLLLSPNVLLQHHVMALPLYTNSRWIVDGDGHRVKLACVNWGAHLEAMVPDGLSRRSLDMISKEIISLGFNCVQLTWPQFMVNDESLASVTVRQSFKNLGLLESIVGIQVNNPSLLDLPLVSAYQAVVDNLAEKNLMVILDNRISKPGWHHSNFNGDKYFDTDLWIRGLTRTATIFNHTINVVGMSLSNEFEGNKQNVNNWYRYMQKGAEAVHAASPNVLVILYELNYDEDFAFFAKQPMNLPFTRKLVFGVHWSGFSDEKAWETGDLNQLCGNVVDKLMMEGQFVLGEGWPLFLSDFRPDLRGGNVNDIRFLNCLLGVAAEKDLDWALGTGIDEAYGLLNSEWFGTGNASPMKRVSLLQSPFLGPDDLLNVRPHEMIFHPSTGLCVLRKSVIEPLKLGSCVESESWAYTPQKTLVVKGTYFCLQADGVGKPAKLGIICNDPGSKWDLISDTKMHLSSKLADGSSVCLDVDSSNSIITNPCKCSSGAPNCDPTSQWFKIVTTTTSSTTAKHPNGNQEEYYYEPTN